MEMKKLKPSPAPVYGLLAFYRQSTRHREPKTRPDTKLEDLHEMALNLCSAEDYALYDH